MRVGTSLAALAFVAALVPAAGRAQLPPPEPTPAVTPAPPPTVVSEIVEVTQVVAPGASVTAFTPPAGTTLVVTDVVLTNTNTTAACGVDVARGGTAVTGGLCVPPRTSQQIALMTGIEFTGETPVQLVSPADAGGPIGVHLRGYLM
ncbi:MAG: hypothetical protein HYU41_20265 [Candidatus Rokubacteria bacterium]|nr:hypothetical protein [Candidatus Rokubacteria bacterium]